MNMFNDLMEKDERLGGLLKDVLLPLDKGRNSRKYRGGGVITNLFWDRDTCLWWASSDVGRRN